MLATVYRKYDQALIVAGCALTSFLTMGWMVNDIHLREKRQLRQEYECKISNLTKEIAMMKMNYSSTQNLK
jgi:hypothetical protein